ncbi:MAG: ATP-binding protein [Euryarchaeota archaeon]|nr:ATP-binding protein [Euryarchaeota archaeon]MDE1836021.1 ATP-binding protein [Euryarchaeota archaeon]MDE1881885.1 ATP-binding protein [Euryarchaeota archaeon]MDE2046393.1 ATP-binding protein [Thermoplasmata archaeon]
MKFVDRSSERELLQNLLTARPPQFVRVAGRRRVGKTALLREILPTTGALYLVADPGEREVQLRALWSQLALATRRPVPPDPTWEGFLDELERSGARSVILDEFQNLIGRDLHVAGQVQRRWEARWHEQGPHLVVSGSSVGMMQALSRYRSGPFYGRLTRDLHLHPFSYAAVRLLYPELKEPERVVRFAIFGRTPYYHQQSVGRSREEALRASMLEPGLPLLDEPQGLLAEETREPTRYHSILSEVARGGRSVRELESRLGVASGGLAPYLRLLSGDLDLLEAETPICGLSKRTRYQVHDPFFRFYYRFIVPLRASIDSGHGREAWAQVRGELDGYVGKVFEDVAREALREAPREGRFAGVPRFTEVGRWWNRVGEEIDLVGRSAKEIWAGEVTWSQRPVSEADVRGLRRKVLLLERTDHLPVRPFWVARGPVAPGAEELLAQEGGKVFALTDLEAGFDRLRP